MISVMLHVALRIACDIFLTSCECVVDGRGNVIFFVSAKSRACRHLKALFSYVNLVLTSSLCDVEYLDRDCRGEGIPVDFSLFTRI